MTSELTLSAARLLSEMSVNPGMALRCRAKAYPAHYHGGRFWAASPGMWGFHGCGPVIGSSADVAELLTAGLIRQVPDALTAPGFTFEHHYYLSTTEIDR